MARYNKTEKGRITSRESSRRFRTTEKGEIARHLFEISVKGRMRKVADSARRKAIRRGMDPLNFPEYRLLAHDPSSECVSCGNKGHLQVDHILSIALGGINNGSNLQLLCADCHKLKTRSDIHLIRSRRLT